MPLHSKTKTNFCSDRYHDRDTDDFSEGRKGRSEKREKRWEKKQLQRKEEKLIPALNALCQKWVELTDQIISLNIDLEPIAGWGKTEQDYDDIMDQLCDLRQERFEIEAKILRQGGEIPELKDGGFFAE